MLASHSMFVSEDQTHIAPVDSSNSFFVGELLWDGDGFSDDCLYEQIVCKVFRQPRQLIAHIQRIYFTYDHQLKEQLYAALVDFLWVLDGKGLQLAQRMLNATLSLLTEQQIDLLRGYLLDNNKDRFTSTKYSLFTLGTVGITILLSEQEHQEKSVDALDIARDFIEYSQLNEAKETLELAVLKMPTRQDLQEELLGLYKSTMDIQAFTDLTKKLKETDATLSVEWLDFLMENQGLVDEK